MYLPRQGDKMNWTSYTGYHNGTFFGGSYFVVDFFTPFRAFNGIKYPVILDSSLTKDIGFLRTVPCTYLRLSISWRCIPDMFFGILTLALFSFRFIVCCSLPFGIVSGGSRSTPWLTVVHVAKCCIRKPARKHARLSSQPSYLFKSSHSEGNLATTWPSVVWADWVWQAKKAIFLYDFFSRSALDSVQLPFRGL